MVTNVNRTSLSDPGQLLQASEKGAGVSTEKPFSSLDPNRDISISKSDLPSTSNGSSLTSAILGSGSESTSSLLSLLETTTQAITGTTDMSVDGDPNKKEVKNDSSTDITVAQTDVLDSKTDTNKKVSSGNSELFVHDPDRENNSSLLPLDPLGSASVSTDAQSSDVLSLTLPLIQTIDKYLLYGQFSEATATESSLAVTA